MMRRAITEERAVLRENSAIFLARFVTEHLASLQPEHVNELMSIALWQFTEARGKYTTRYATLAALVPGTSDLRHEHVIPRKNLRLAILKHPNRVEPIMRLAVACIVTHGEHQLLSARHFGWNRYIEAGLTVVDRLTGEHANLSAMADALAHAWAIQTAQVTS